MLHSNMSIMYSNINKLQLINMVRIMLVCWRWYFSRNNFGNVRSNHWFKILKVLPSFHQSNKEFNMVSHWCLVALFPIQILLLVTVTIALHCRKHAKIILIYSTFQFVLFLIFSFVMPTISKASETTLPQTIHGMTSTMLLLGREAFTEAKGIIAIETLGWCSTYQKY